MLMAMEASSAVLDRSLQPKREPRRASLTDKLSMRRWSLRGTSETRGKDAAPTSTYTTHTTPTAVNSPPPAATAESDKDKRKRSRSVDLSPLQSNLKKAPSVLSSKLAQCVEAMGLRDALHRYKHKKHDEDDESGFPHNPQLDSSKRRVHFPASAHHFKQVYERPSTTEAEKANYHYSRQELMDMVLEAKESLARETRFSAQPEHTILEQGFLTLPNELHFFHHKRYYCVLKARELLCYSSPAHAAKQSHLKCRIPILKVQDCSTMSLQAKIAAFGAHLPACMSLLFFVTKADGERVLLAAGSRMAKKSWVSTLSRLTQVHEVLPACVLRQTSTASSTSTCHSEDEAERSPSTTDDEEEKPERPETNESKKQPRNSCECNNASDGACCR